MGTLSLTTMRALPLQGEVSIRISSFIRISPSRPSWSSRSLSPTSLVHCDLTRLDTTHKGSRFETPLLGGVPTGGIALETTHFSQEGLVWNPLVRKDSVGSGGGG